MPNISLTSFTDFVLANGRSQVTRVRNIMNQLDEDYSPASDYYRGVREAILSFHAGNPRALDQCLQRTHERRLQNYADVVDGYRQFLKRARPSMSNFAQTSYWTHSELTVTVNPELFLEIAGRYFHVKLYFKAEAISAARADVVLHLMETTLPHTATAALLDIRRGKLHEARKSNSAMNAYLAGQAAAFSEIWKQLDSSS